MSSTHSKAARRAAVALASTALMGIVLSTAPARAGDDGEAPIWAGFGNVLGLVKNDNDVNIEYRERGKLVLPPKLDLPPPGSAAIQPNSAWPVDPDVQKEKRAKLEAKKPVLVHPGRPAVGVITPGSTVTMSSTAGQGPAAEHCANPEPRTGECPPKPGRTLNYNPLTWVGLQKKPPTVLGPEPDRDNLTDPPKGLRAPVEGVGAKVDN
jgi:hypothetical protein